MTVSCKGILRECEGRRKIYPRFKRLVRNYLNKILPVELFLCEPEVKSVEGAWDLTDLLHLDVVLRDPVKYLCSDGDLRNKVEKMRKRCLITSAPIGAWK